jgi:hypothetical protein
MATQYAAQMRGFGAIMWEDENPRVKVSELTEVACKELLIAVYGARAVRHPGYV